MTRTVDRLEPGGTVHTIVLDDDHHIAAGTVILATGIEWRRISVPGIERLVGHGVYYGAAPSEASLVQGRAVHLVGGGNSAGQAAMFFAEYADSVTILVRGSSLAASMSQYLIDRLSTQANVRVELGVEVTGVEGQESLQAIDVTSDQGRRRERRRSDALFVLIGGEPQTAWLPPALIRDQWGYICTGRDVLDLLRERPPASWPLERDPFLLETSIPGVFAAGDVRHGSIKRCAAAVGEGSMAIAVAHQYLGELRATAATSCATRLRWCLRSPARSPRRPGSPRRRRLVSPRWPPGRSDVPSPLLARFATRWCRRSRPVVAEQSGERAVRAAGGGVLRHSIERRKHPRPDVELVGTLGIEVDVGRDALGGEGIEARSR